MIDRYKKPDMQMLGFDFPSMKKNVCSVVTMCFFQTESAHQKTQHQQHQLFCLPCKVSWLIDSVSAMIQKKHL